MDTFLVQAAILYLTTELMYVLVFKPAGAISGPWIMLSLLAP